MFLISLTPFVFNLLHLFLERQACFLPRLAHNFAVAHQLFLYKIPSLKALLQIHPQFGVIVFEIDSVRFQAVSSYQMYFVCAKIQGLFFWFKLDERNCTIF